MSQLNNSGMRDRLDELVLTKKIPVIGICVGMQMMAKKSDEGDEIQVEKLDGNVGESVNLDKVLICGEGESAKVGTPFLEGCSVVCEVTEQYRDKKIIVFKKHRRKNYRRKNGHRQSLTRLKVTAINA